MTDTANSPSATGRRRWLVVVVASVSVLTLVAVGLVGTRILGVWGSDPDPEAQPSPSPTEPPSPFAGTPAEDFAEGAAGIELPPAEPVGEYTADQVQDALEQVREALIAARLEESMIVDHDPDDFLATLAPDVRPALQVTFEADGFAAFATQIAEEARLVPVAPRVAGSMSYEVTTAERDLPAITVTTRFAWVYPFETGDDQLATDLVVVRDELVWLYRQGYPWTEASQGLWLAEEASGVWGADCDVANAGELAPDADPVAVLAEQAEMIFDPERPLDGGDDC
jgi:hypothetical protein